MDEPDCLTCGTFSQSCTSFLFVLQWRRHCRNGTGNIITGGGRSNNNPSFYKVPRGIRRLRGLSERPSDSGNVCDSIQLFWEISKPTDISLQKQMSLHGSLLQKECRRTQTFFLQTHSLRHPVFTLPPLRLKTYHGEHKEFTQVARKNSIESRTPCRERKHVMKQEMIVNCRQSEECRIAVLEDGVLEELYVERSSQSNYVGNIYKGVIVNLESSIQAAFVDFGVGRNGFLHISDVEPCYFQQVPDWAEREREAEEQWASRYGDRYDRQSSMDDGLRNRPRFKPPIQEVFKRGDEVLVQVIKEGIGHKGPTLSTYISIPGRYLVLMP